MTADVPAGARADAPPPARWPELPPGHVAATDEQAQDEFWPRYREVITRYSRIRGFAIPTEDSFLREIGPHGALHVGSPETVAQKIAQTLTALGANRIDLKYGIGRSLAGSPDDQHRAVRVPGDPASP